MSNLPNLPNLATATASAYDESIASILAAAPLSFRATNEIEAECLASLEAAADKRPTARRAPSAPRSSTTIFAPTDVITVLVANPKKVGSAARGRFDLYTSGQTIAAAIAAGVLRADIRHDLDHGFVAVG